MRKWKKRKQEKEGLKDRNEIDQQEQRTKWKKEKEGKETRKTKKPLRRQHVSFHSQRYNQYWVDFLEMKKELVQLKRSEDDRKKIFMLKRKKEKRTKKANKN